MGQTTKMGEFVKQAIEEGRLEEAGGMHRRLARILYNERPELFVSLEQCRGIIRYYTGNRGKKNRDNIADRKHLDTKPYIYDVPQHIYEEPKEVQIPTALTRIGIVSDIHVPFQNNDAVKEAFERLRAKKINCLILNGDIMDCASISRFEKDRSTPDLTYELDALYEFFIMTRSVFPKIPIYYKIGNHEERFEKLFWQKASEIAREYTFTEMASLNDFNILEVGGKDVMTIQDLKVYHGHELGIQARVHPAKSAFNKTFGQENLLFGHVHKRDQFKMGNSKEVHAVGCLCNLTATYDSLSKYAWNHGYAYVEQKNNGFKIDNVRL